WHELHIGERLQQQDADVKNAADAGSSIADLAWPLPGKIDQLAHVARRQRRVRKQRHADAGKPADRLEVIVRIVRQLGIEEWVGYEGTSLDGHERVAIRRGLGDSGGADVVSCAASVLDDDTLAPGLRQALGDIAR